MSRKVERTKHPYSCPLCAKSFKWPYEVRSHMQRHTAEKPFKCDICSKDFCTKSELDQHFPRHSNTRPHKCPHPGCNKAFKTKSDSKEHQQSHNKHPPFMCIFCEQTTRRKKCLLLHIRTHIREKPCISKVCGDEKGSSLPAEDHYLWYHTDERPFKCDPCSLVFRSRSGLSYHKRTIHAPIPPPRRKFRCADCGEQLATRTALGKHSEVHTGIQNPYSCSLCDKAFLTSGSLELHIRRHTGERPYKCSVCSRAFTISSNLSRHFKTHASNRKKYPCTECNKTYYSASDLTRHRKQAHLQKRPQECVFCGAAFSSAPELFAHLRIHINEKPSICKVCGLERRLPLNLQDHYVRCHVKQRFFLTCGFCGKSYFSAKSLRAHEIAIHKGERKRIERKMDLNDYLLFD